MRAESGARLALLILGCWGFSVGQLFSGESASGAGVGGAVVAVTGVLLCQECQQHGGGAPRK